jgi:hypothetical protein
MDSVTWFWREMARETRLQEKASADGIPALDRLLGVARGTCGDAPKAAAFLLGIYGARLAFDLNAFQCLAPVHFQTA